MNIFIKYRRIIGILTVVMFLTVIAPLNGLMEDVGIIKKTSAFSTSDTYFGKVSFGNQTAFAVNSSGVLYGWGYGSYIESVYPTYKIRPAIIGDNYKFVSAGMSNALGINYLNQLMMLGYDPGTSNKYYSTPTKVLDNIIFASAQQYNSFAIDTNNNLIGWGLNQSGTLGLGTETQVSTPTAIMSNVKYVCTGSEHSMAITTDGSLYTWGNNQYGQLGRVTNNVAEARNRVKIMDNVIFAAVGNYHSLAITADGKLWTWGLNSQGQLGNGTNGIGVFSSTPVNILENVDFASATQASSFAILKDGTLLSWGSNEVGQLGDGTTVNRNNPSPIMTNVVYISSGSNNCIAIDKMGDIWTWGYNEYGQIGNGTSGMYTYWSTPQKIVLSTPAINTGLTNSSISQNQKLNIDEVWARFPERLIADPIDAASGAQLMSKPLLHVKGAIDFGFELKYNSLLLNNSVLGKAWGHNYEGSLSQIDANNLTVNWGANNKSSYVKSGSVYQSTNFFVPYENITTDSSNNYILKKQDGTKYIFNSLGKMTEIVNRTGQKLLLVYNANNKLSTVTEPISSKKLFFSYDASNRINKVNDDLERNILFSYDSNGNLNSIKDPMEYITSYTYNNQGQILTSTDSESRTLFTNTYDNSGRIAYQEDSLSKTMAFEYDEISQPGSIITKVRDRNGNSKVLTHDSNYYLLSVKDENSNTTQYSYDSQGNRTQVTDAKGNITKLTYDERGNVLTVTDALNRVTTFNYESNDNLLQITDAANNSRLFTYDSNNNMLTQQDATGNITTYTYDSNGLLTSSKLPEGGITNYEYITGLLSKSTDSTGVYQTYTHDASGRMTQIANPAGKSTTFMYDNNDNVTKVTDPLNQATQFVFDGYGNKLSQTDARGNAITYTYYSNGKPSSITDALNNKVQFVYDNEERLTQVTDPKGNITTYIYDLKGRRIQTKDPMGNTISSAYDEVDRLVSVADAMGNAVATNSYDVVGNALNTTDALGRIVTRQFDNLNRVTQSTDPMSKTTKMFYDVDGRLISVTDPKNQTSNQAFNKNGEVTSITDISGNVTSFTYDTAGRVTSRTNSSGKQITNSYNNLGQVQSAVNGRGQQAVYTYDDVGRVVSMTDPVDGITYTYDTVGNVTSVQDSKGTISYIYDALNRVTQYTDTNGNVLKYSYDANSNLSTLTYPDNKTVTYEYDAANRMTKVTDWASRVTAYDYDADSRLVTTTNADGSIVTRTYDAMSQMLTQTDKDKNGANITGYTFTYHDDGNVKSEKSAGTKSRLGLTPMTITYGTSNQAISFNGQALIFDDDGNMTTGPVKGTMGTLTYNARNQLTTAGALSYDYDALGTRTSVTDSVYGTKTTAVVNPIAVLSQTLVEKDKDGNVISNYVYGLGLVGMQTADRGYYTYHYDSRGSTVALTDATGAVTDRYNYGPFGELLSKTGTTRNVFLYDGRDGVVTDSNSLYYMRARYYSPDMKRFINEDTVLGGILNGQSLNRFAYVNGNPISRIDPLGLCGENSKNGNDYSLSALMFTGLLALEGGLVADDVTGVGIVDDVAIVPVAVIGGIIIGGTIIYETYIKADSGNPPKYKKSKSGTGKEKATDVPSWSKGNKPLEGESGNEFAKRLCDEKFGPGGYDKGPASDFNKIKKWGDRAFE